MGDDALTGLNAEKLGSAVGIKAEVDLLSVTDVDNLESRWDDTTVVIASFPTGLDDELGETDDDMDDVLAMIGDTVAIGGDVTDFGKIGDGIIICCVGTAMLVNVLGCFSSSDSLLLRDSLLPYFLENFGVCGSISLRYLSLSVSGNSIDFDFPWFAILASSFLLACLYLKILSSLVLPAVARFSESVV